MSLYVDIEKDFGGFLLRTNFETDGSVLGILGASGCGKSMTLRRIAGIVKPDKGKIILDGRTLFDSERRINLPPQKRGVGLLFQNYALFPNMTVWQNLMTGLRCREKDKKKATDEVQEMIERFYLTGLEQLKPSQLSGGQQQRVALARILLSKPQVLMLDEPFSALDGYLRWQMELELASVLEKFEGSTLFVSHSRDEVYRICDSVCVMNHGQSTQVLPVKEMFEKPESLEAALLSGCKNYSRAVMVNKTQVKAIDWGITLDCAYQDVENITHIGVRSHYIHLISEKEAKNKRNTIQCQILREIENVFSMVVMVCPVTAPQNVADSQSEQKNKYIRLEMEKEVWETYAREELNGKEDALYIQIDRKDVLLLK